MRNICFDNGVVRWDAWKRPHCTVDRSGLFFMFDTGEIVLRGAYITPDHRTYYHELGLAICASDGLDQYRRNDVVITTPDDAVVLKTHLSQLVNGNTEQQLMCVDTGRREIYAIKNKPAGKGLPSVPSMFKQCPLYWPTYDDRPVSHPVRLVTPRKLNKEQRERRAEANLLCQAKARLKGLDDSYYIGTSAYVDKVYDTDESIVDLVSYMDDNTVSYAACNGLPNKQVKYAPYLKF